MTAKRPGATTEADDAIGDRPEVDRLYDLDRSDFVAARDALAKEVSAQDKEAGRAIKRLRKPTTAAWAVNVVARERPDDVAALLAAGDEVRRAQEEVLAGGERDVLKETVEKRRFLVGKLTDAAVARSAESQRDDIDATFEAASVDEEIGGALRRGRLTTAQPRPSGFGLVAGMEGAGSGRSRRSADHDRDERARAEADELRSRLERADAEVAERRTDLDRAQQALTDAQRRVDEAGSELERTMAERDAIAARLTDR